MDRVVGNRNILVKEWPTGADATKGLIGEELTGGAAWVQGTAVEMISAANMATKKVLVGIHLSDGSSTSADEEGVLSVIQNSVEILRVPFKIADAATPYNIQLAKQNIQLYAGVAVTAAISTETGSTTVYCTLQTSEGYR